MVVISKSKIWQTDFLRLGAGCHEVDYLFTVDLIWSGFLFLLESGFNCGAPYIFYLTILVVTVLHNTKRLKYHFLAP